MIQPESRIRPPQQDLNHDHNIAVGEVGVGAEVGHELAPVVRDTRAEHPEDEEPEVVEDDGDDSQEEFQQQRGLRDPGQPTQAERDEHDLTHIPFRPWCEHCVRGKSKRNPNRRLCGEYSQHRCPKIRMDYAKLTENVEKVTSSDDGQEEETVRSGDGLQILVMHESQHRSVWAYTVEAKGAAEEWVLHQVLEDLETVGLRNERVVLKADQEPAIAEVLREIAKLRKDDYGTGIDNSSVGESNTNATVERAIQDVEGQCRTLRSALEHKLQHRMPLNSSVFPWLIRHSGCLITRCRIRPEGRTSFEMIRGQRPHSQLAEFGEIVMFRIPHTKLSPGKIEEQWDDGVYLGFDMRSCESLIGTSVGVFKVKDLKRKALDSRWSVERLLAIKGHPSAPVPGQSYRRTPAFSKRFEGEHPQSSRFVPQPEPEVPTSRNWRITKDDVFNLKPTDGCAGCRAVVKKTTQKPHSQECRTRMEGLLMETEEGRDRIARAMERACHQQAQSAQTEQAPSGQG